jgi:hypothetical protein
MTGPMHRIKRASPSVTTISDKRGPCALNAIRAHAVTYPAEGHFEDYAPPGVYGGSIASSKLRKRIQKEGNWATSAGGKLTYITCQKTKCLGPPR